jgi:hypothetical protein
MDHFANLYKPNLKISHPGKFDFCRDYAASLVGQREHSNPTSLVPNDDTNDPPKIIESPRCIKLVLKPESNSQNTAVINSDTFDSPIDHKRPFSPQCHDPAVDSSVQPQEEFNIECLSDDLKKKIANESEDIILDDVNDYLNIEGETMLDESLTIQKIHNQEQGKRKEIQHESGLLSSQKNKDEVKNNTTVLNDLDICKSEF